MCIQLGCMSALGANDYAAYVVGPSNLDTLGTDAA